MAQRGRQNDAAVASIDPANFELLLQHKNTFGLA